MALNSILRNALFGTLLLLLLPRTQAVSASTNASEYFTSLTSDEKVVFTDWLSTNGTIYPRHAFMPSAAGTDNGAAVFWDIDCESIHVAIAVQGMDDPNGVGWVGFGLSEAGGMIGADMALFESSTLQLTDAHVVEERSFPIVDDCQDWLLNDAIDANDWIIVEFSRKLDTGDDQDHAIKNDDNLWLAPTRLIAAWGHTGSISYHGQKKARKAVRLFASSNEDEASVLIDTLEAGSGGLSFELRENDYEIPADDTTYHTVCKTFDELNLDLPPGPSMVTMIGGVPVINEDTAQFLHHFMVYLQKDCSGDALQRSMIYGWAPGDEGWALPDNVGFPVFNTEYNQAVYVRIHFDNPSMISGSLHSIGLKFYYTLETRTHDAAILELGDPTLTLVGNLISQGITQYDFSCPGACSSTYLGNDNVTILAEYLHMHQTGTRMTNEVVRDGVIHHSAAVDVYDFKQQGAIHIQQAPYEVSAGDAFKTSCYYRDGDQFGISSQQEMCIAYLLYYPAKQSQGFTWVCNLKPGDWPDDGTGCSQELENTDLNDISQSGRVFGTPTNCQLDHSSSTNIQPAVTFYDKPT